ncbi:hypothetical protein ACVGVM_09770 [Pseudonocardia bannensis]|uniref:Uncharacterized protein n=1 Tax=Pseudonocardia bannensis TaxID=630973 RepID=A0A848DS70_9PSEU|nr:hypothetical protein [Pseudonocardia bannensis]NMH95266.1 hypothetical protein [Pseudonocardia bannensis]
MGDYDDADLGRRPGRRRWGPIVLAVAALVVGLVAGYLVRAASEPPPVTSPPAAPAPAPRTTDPSAAPTTPCIAMAQHGTDLIAELERAVRAIGELDPGALRAVLEEVRQLRAELQRDVDACRGWSEGARAPAGPPPTTAAPG